MRVKSHSGARQHTPALIGWSIRGSVRTTKQQQGRRRDVYLLMSIIMDSLPLSFQLCSESRLTKTKIVLLSFAESSFSYMWYISIIAYHDGPAV